MQTSNSSSSPGMGRAGSVMSDLCVEKDLKNWEEGPEELSNVMTSEETESNNTQWTDEKHSLYLKSMEASFVNQLYDTLGGCSHQEYSSEPKSCRHMNNVISTPPGQFKVFKDGSWARVNFNNFRRDMSRLKKVEKSGHIFTNPWIQHYRSLSRHQSSISPSLQTQAPASRIVDSSALQFSCQGSLDSPAEVTDQNFVDEVPEEERPSRMHRYKYRKLSAASGLSNDQVVPLAQLSLTENSVDGSPE